MAKIFKTTKIDSDLSNAFDKFVNDNLHTFLFPTLYLEFTQTMATTKFM